MLTVCRNLLFYCFVFCFSGCSLTQDCGFINIESYTPCLLYFCYINFFYFLQNAKRIFNADCLSNSIQCVTYSLLYCIYFIRNCSFLIQDHRKNVSQILQLILFVPINFPSVAWGNVLLCFLAWYTFFKLFFFLISADVSIFSDL